MVTPIGPWVEMIMVLTASGIIRTLARRYTSAQQATAITAITAASGIAGIVGTACGFVIPTIYFLDAQAYATWFTSPYVAWVSMASLVCAAGGWGMVLAWHGRTWFLRNQRMPFPVGEMVHNIVHMGKQLWSIASLATGFFATIGYGVLQHTMQIVPRLWRLTHRAFTWGYVTIPKLAIQLDIAPMLIAIGFVAGHVLAVPLCVGIVTKLGVLEPLYRYLSPATEYNDAVLAFGSGLLLYSTITSFTKFPYIIVSGYRWMRDTYRSMRNNHVQSYLQPSLAFVSGAVLLSIAVLWGANFSFVSQLYTVALTTLCVYQILIIAGRVGLAPFGRFATFLMLPGTLLFAFQATHITVISAFVAIACGVAADTLFGQKAADTKDVSTATVTRYQCFGLIVAALTIGPVLWLLFTKLGLGTPELLAQRAQARAALISVYQFDHALLACGFIWGVVLHLCGINATLVFSGLLFPVTFSAMLIIGGMLTKVTRNTKAWEPLFSGIFAANSLWLVVRALTKAIGV